MAATSENFRGRAEVTFGNDYDAIHVIVNHNSTILLRPVYQQWWRKLFQSGRHKCTTKKHGKLTMDRILTVFKQNSKCKRGAAQVPQKKVAAPVSCDPSSATPAYQSEERK